MQKGLIVLTLAATLLAAPACGSWENVPHSTDPASVGDEPLKELDKLLKTSAGLHPSKIDYFDGYITLTYIYGGTVSTPTIVWADIDSVQILHHTKRGNWTVRGLGTSGQVVLNYQARSEEQARKFADVVAVLRAQEQ